jgi:hypothetical protein
MLRVRLGERETLKRQGETKLVRNATVRQQATTPKTRTCSLMPRFGPISAKD